MRLFVASQVLLVVFALFFQIEGIHTAKSTESITISMFICFCMFTGFNSGLSFTLWRPFGRPEGYTFTKAELDARAGCLVYLGSCLLYAYVALNCFYQRKYVEHVPTFQEQDFYTLAFFFAIITALYLLFKTSGVEEPLLNPRIAGIIALFAALVPHISAGIRILDKGTEAISEVSIWCSLGMIISKLLYYAHIRKEAGKNIDEVHKAEGVLIAEFFGNCLTWLFVIGCYYYMQ